MDNAGFNLVFREIELEDKKMVDGYLEESNFMGSEYSFAVLFMWRRKYATRIAEYGGRLFILKRIKNVDCYVFPAGGGDLKAAVEAIMSDARRRGVPWNIYGVTGEGVDALNGLFPGMFEFHSNRDLFDYIYDTRSLIDLPGRQYHSKRSHINKFVALYGSINYEDITPKSVEECRDAYLKWLEEKKGEAGGLEDEQAAMNECFSNYKQLGLSGGLIRVEGGKVCSFSFGGRINGDTFGIHAEKSVIDCRSGYAVINREFAARHASGYKYVNREEDLGIKGLRKAKLSYKPAFLLEKFSATVSM